MAVEFGKWEKIERKETVSPILQGVEEIDILNLDEGAQNDGTGNLGNYGMLYGKTYKLKVSKFVYGKLPANMNDIKWEFSYLDNDNNLLSEIINKTGKEIDFECNNLDFCGRTITFYAWVEGIQNTKAELEVFCHNRFRWFDRVIFERELTERTDKKHPFLIDQGNSPLCGMACLFYIFAKTKPEEYKAFSFDLFTKGKAIYNNYEVKPVEKILETTVDFSGFPVNTNKMPIVDFVTLFSLRNSKKKKFTKSKQQWKGINWPWTMKNLCGDFLGYKDVKSRYWPLKTYMMSVLGFSSKIRRLKKIDNYYQSGYKICMMVDVSMLYLSDSNVSLSDLGEYHWIVYEGDLELLDKNTNPAVTTDEVAYIKFSAFSWAEIFDNKTINPTTGASSPKIVIDRNKFIYNFYGYIRMK